MISTILSSPKFFPCASIVLGLGAAARYAAVRDVWHCTYWVLGTAMTAVATFLLKGS